MRAVVAVVIVVVAADVVLAQTGPFGVGVPGRTSPVGGPFASFFAYVAAKQAEFYRALTGAVQAMKADGTAFWALAGLSFLYGIFHAAGPGHGKAILSSYMLANEQTARRGIVLALASSMAQAVTAVGMVTIAAVILRLTSIAMTETTRAFEIGSYVLVVLLGLWLVKQKVFGGGHHHHHHDHGHHDGHDHDNSHHHDDHHHHHHHHPEPSELGGDAFSWRQAWSVILAIGLRPCTGALIVLVFALSQGLFLAGIASAFVMALGTALTVAVLALIAVGAKGLAVRLAGGHSSGLADKIHRATEVLGAFAVLALGLILLIAALGWGG